MTVVITDRVYQITREVPQNSVISGPIPTLSVDYCLCTRISLGEIGKVSFSAHKQGTVGLVIRRFAISGSRPLLLQVLAQALILTA